MFDSRFKNSLESIIMIIENKLIYLAVALLCMGVIASSCENGLEGLNDNPNAPTDVPTDLILPQSQARGTLLEVLHPIPGQP